MATNIVIKNTNQLNYLKITQQTQEIPDEKHKSKEIKWKEMKADMFLKPGDVAEVWVGGTNRVIIAEMPS